MNNFLCFVLAGGFNLEEFVLRILITWKSESRHFFFFVTWEYEYEVMIVGNHSESISIQMRYAFVP